MFSIFVLELTIRHIYKSFFCLYSEFASFKRRFQGNMPPNITLCVVLDVRELQFLLS